jgi:2-dehydro-3-deoxygalactonokinase
MRGEELQILGWLQQQTPEAGEKNLLVLPGTHNKWAVLDGKRVSSFVTAFTGELFDLLKRHSVLIGPAELDGFCEAAFADGVRTVEQSRGASLIHTLFAVRSNQLLANKSVEHSLSFLSGQIIATDIRGALEVFEGIHNITIIGDTKLADRYQLVLEHWGHRVERCNPEEIAARGYESVYCTLFT